MCCRDSKSSPVRELMGEPYAISDYVVAGSKIAWGGHVLLPNSNTPSGWGDDVEGPVKQALWNHGGFSWVDAGKESGFVNPYISIKVTTRIDFAHLGDIFNTIQGAIYQAGYRPEAQAFWIESVPSSAQNNPNVAQAGTGGTTNASAQSNGGFNLPSLSLPSLSDIFGDSNGGYSETPIDTLARWFNVTPTKAAFIGAGLAVGGVILIKRIL